MRAAPSYPLYYVLDVPPFLTGYEMDEAQNQHTYYTSLLRGTLGGLGVDSGSLLLHPGASTKAGGGDFALKTTAGAVKNGHVLMTVDGQKTTLLFFGTYLGANLEFRLIGPAKDLGSVRIEGKGLAGTSFAAHSEYLAAVTQAAAALPPTVRAQLVTQADGNLRLVTVYQTTSGSP